MTLLSDLLGLKDLEEAKKKPKCTCETDEATCKVHGKKLDESAEYEDSSEFTDDWLDAKDHFEKAHKIVSDPKFKAWMKITDQNYGTDCEEALRSILGGMETAKEGWDDLDNQMEQADNG